VLLDDPACRLVTLVGPGGIGKTRLALEAGASRRERHRDGVVTVSFAGTSPARPEEAADLVVTNLAAALGVSLAVPRDPRELLADALAGRELLLVLDNLERLRDAAGVLAELLGRAPGVQILGTSRRRLGLGVEWLVEVPGLPYPPPEAEAEAAGYPAVQLFEDRARLLRPGFGRPPTWPPWGGSAGWWPGCRWPSSWPPAGFARPPRQPSPTAWPPGATCWRRPPPTWSRATAASAR